MKLSKDAILKLPDENDRDIANYLQSKKEKSVQNIFKSSTLDMRRWFYNELRKKENVLFRGLWQYFCQIDLKKSKYKTLFGPNLWALSSENAIYALKNEFKAYLDPDFTPKHVLKRIQKL